MQTRYRQARARGEEEFATYLAGVVHGLDMALTDAREADR